MAPLLSDPERWHAWNNFLEATGETGFMQSSWWALCRSPVGFEHFAVTVKDQDTILGGALVAKWSYAPQSCFYYIQDGPVLPGDDDSAGDVYQAILDVIEKHRMAEPQTVSHLRIEPRWQQLPEFVRGFRAIEISDIYTEPRNTLCVDLRPSEENILAQMRPKGRYNIRVAQKHGVIVTEDNSDQGLVDFLRIQRRTAVRQGIGIKPASYFRTLISEFSSAHKISLFFAEYKQRRVATALVVFFGKRATYFFGGSLALHRHVMAPYLLHFEIMKKAKALGSDCYDFWGIAPENQPDHSWQNISVFKRKFGGLEINLVPTLDHIYDPVAYNHYITSKREPAQITA